MLKGQQLRGTPLIPPKTSQQILIKVRFMLFLVIDGIHISSETRREGAGQDPKGIKREILTT